MAGGTGVLAVYLNFAEQKFYFQLLNGTFMTDNATNHIMHLYSLKKFFIAANNMSTCTKLIVVFLAYDYVQRQTHKS